MSRQTFSDRCLTCNEKGEFTVLIADPQCDSDYQWEEAAEELEILMEKEKPDFVLVNGDIYSYCDC